MKKILLILFLYALWSVNANAFCIEGNCLNGKGTYKWSNGDQYSGDWKNGKHHGKGTLEWIDGTKYSGDWEFGLENGQATITWANGDKYIGGRKNNQADGQGTYIFANGNKLVGEWENGNLVKKLTNQNVKKVSKLKYPVGKVIWKNEHENDNNECKLLERDPAKIYYRNLNWKEEEKNIKRKRYVYKDQRNLTFRDVKDPSALKEIRFIKLTSGKKIKGIKGIPRIRNTNKIKPQEIEYHAYIYHVTYAKCDFVIEFRVHEKFKREKADELIKKYAYMLGQMPFFLRHGHEITRSMTEHFRPHRVTILPGSRSSFSSFEVIEDRKRTDENMFGDMGYTFTLHPEANSMIFYTLLHEAAHAGFERHLLNSRKWFNAVKADNVYITEYARTNPSEDVAETVAYWMAIRCYKDEGKAKRILKNIPNRIKVLDELNLNTYPLVCK